MVAEGLASESSKRAPVYMTRSMCMCQRGTGHQLTAEDNYGVGPGLGTGLSPCQPRTRMSAGIHVSPQLTGAPPPSTIPTLIPGGLRGVRPSPYPHSLPRWIERGLPFPLSSLTSQVALEVFSAVSRKFNWSVMLAGEACRGVGGGNVILCGRREERRSAKPPELTYACHSDVML